MLSKNCQVLEKSFFCELYLIIDNMEEMCIAIHPILVEVYDSCALA